MREWLRRGLSFVTSADARSRELAVKDKPWAARAIDSRVLSRGGTTEGCAGRSQSAATASPASTIAPQRAVLLTARCAQLLRAGTPALPFVAFALRIVVR